MRCTTSPSQGRGGLARRRELLRDIAEQRQLRGVTGDIETEALDQPASSTERLRIRPFPSRETELAEACSPDSGVEAECIQFWRIDANGTSAE